MAYQRCFLILTQVFPGRIPSKVADELNMESGRIYTSTMKWHWRIYRRSGQVVWLSQYRNETFVNGLSEQTTLHSHSRQAAQQAFYKAVATARTLRKNGDRAVRFPYKRKRFRTTIWKNTGIEKEGGVLHLKRARGIEPVVVRLPDNLKDMAGEKFKEARLVYNQQKRRYDWHLVIDKGFEPSLPPGDKVIALDLGEIHPVVATDLSQAVIFSVRELRALYQYRNKQMASIQRARSGLKKQSRKWWRLERRKRKLLAFVERKSRDILHKISRAVVEWAVEREAGTIAIGDVRNVAKGKRLCRKSQQKISQWPHGKLRRYIQYKAEAAGIAVELVNEAYSTKSCPDCGHQSKRSGRQFYCAQCGLVSHRDVVGATNILSIYDFGHVSGYRPATDIKVSYPFWVMRSSPGHGASSLA